MADLSGFLGGAKDAAAGEGGGGFSVMGMITTIGTIIVGIIILALCAYLIYYYAYKKKNWNLSIEVKIPRSDGRFVDSENAKGNYNENRGVCYIKRKGKKAVPMKPFDVKRYVQGKKTLTVVQVSPGEYLPVLPDSFLELEDDQSGESASVIKLKGDLSKSKAWKNSFEREAKKAYSLVNLLKEYMQFIGWGIIILMNFVGFTILARSIKG